jgi:hypothetical protein
MLQCLAHAHSSEWPFHSHDLGDAFFEKNGPMLTAMLRFVPEKKVMKFFCIPFDKEETNACEQRRVE